MPAAAPAGGKVGCTLCSGLITSGATGCAGTGATGGFVGQHDGVPAGAGQHAWLFVVAGGGIGGQHDGVLPCGGQHAGLLAGGGTGVVACGATGCTVIGKAAASGWCK